MRFLSNALSTSLLGATLLGSVAQADTGQFDPSTNQLNLPSVALVQGGQIQGYFSLNLKIGEQDGKLVILDNAYFNSLAPIQAVPMTDKPSATFSIDTLRLDIPEVAFSNIPNAPTFPLNFRLLAALDTALVLGF